MPDPSRLDDLELKLAYVERSNQELSDVIYRQQQALDRLAARLEQLIDRLQSLEQRPRDYTTEEESPPHY
jgi:uncharacterized coiled-coil protein SlyX